ncbi:MAG: host-nuclease inhibitor Gam family protein [Verrucomicrobiae bacterium]|nr:host-nuclease inhibitor Gam family protein [Verrucomicrobiae bacterium]
MGKIGKRNTRLVAVEVASKEAMIGVVAEIVRLRLRMAEVTAQMEQDVAEVQARYAPEIEELGRAVAANEVGVHAWALRNPKEFQVRRSIDLPSAEVGFRTSPPKVEKIRSKQTWEQIALVMTEYEYEADEAPERFSGADYIRQPAPEIDKEKLIADRAKIPPQALEQIGVRIVQEDVFSIRPKSDLIGAGPSVAAGREAA